MSKNKWLLLVLTILPMLYIMRNNFWVQHPGSIMRETFNLLGVYGMTAVVNNNAFGADYSVRVGRTANELANVKNDAIARHYQLGTADGAYLWDPLGSGNHFAQYLGISSYIHFEGAM